MERVLLYDVTSAPNAPPVVNRDRLVGCIANFQEARKREIIDALSSAVVKTPGCHLLDEYVTPSINRTNFTIIGTPDDIVECALNMARVAFGQIDMRLDPGLHPSIGAFDECPFFPVKGVTMDDCKQCADNFGQRLGDNLQVPVYLHDFSAIPVRRLMYKRLEAKLADNEWKPNFGPAKFVPTWGATKTGACHFRISYNVNINFPESEKAQDHCHGIAMDVRESGRPGSDQPGALKAVKAIDWWSPEYNVYQIAMYLDDIEQTPMHVAYGECLMRCENVCGSEVVGLVPLKAVLAAADFYIQKEELGNLDESQKVNLAIDRLGLNSVAVFNPRMKIIEYAIANMEDRHLSSTVLKSLMLNAESRSSNKGCGSTMAANGAMGAAIDAIVSWVVYMNRKSESVDPTVKGLISSLKRVMHNLTPMMYADRATFTAFKSALELPQRTPGEKSIRNKNIISAAKDAVAIPMNVAITVNECWGTLKKMAHNVNQQCKKEEFKRDLKIGCSAMKLTVERAYYNVMMNLGYIQDASEGELQTEIIEPDYMKTAEENIETLIHEAENGARDVLKIINEQAK